MLRKIKLTNFKCFKNTELTCAPLTLLCGLNGMGKSSVIQALLVLRQSSTTGELREGRLVLGGELADLGTGQDVLCEDAEADVVEFELHRADNPTPCRFSFDYSRTADELRTRGASQGVVSPTDPGSNVLNQWTEIPPLGGRLVYVNAERIGPRKFYHHSEVFARRGNLGTRGEYTTELPERPTGREPVVKRSPMFRSEAPSADGSHRPLVAGSNSGCPSSTGDDPGRRCHHCRLLLRPSWRRGDETLPRDERWFRPVLHTAGTDGPVGAARLSVPDREPGGSPASQRSDQIGRAGSSRLACGRTSDCRNTQRSLHGRCPHCRSGRSGSTGGRSVPLFLPRRCRIGGVLPASGC